MANSISHASLPYPVKNARYTIGVPYLDADGDPTDPTTPDTEVSQDGGAFADAAEEVTTISGSNGVGYITLTGAEMNNSLVSVVAKVSSGPKATIALLYPRVLPILLSGTASAGASGSITVAAGAYDLTGCIVRTTGGTGGGGTGGANNQARMITAYNTSTLVATVVPNWETTPDNTTTYDILLTDLAVNSPITRGLRPTTDGRTLDVSSGGEAGVDWANVGGQTTSVTLTNTLVNADVTKISTDATAADNLETMLDGTGGQTLSLGGLTIVKASGHAVEIESQAAGHGIVVTANGANKSALNLYSVLGQALIASSDATDQAAVIITGAQNAMEIYSYDVGHGIVVTGLGASKHALFLTPGSGGNALHVAGPLAVTGATTLTGAVTASNASNQILLGTGMITAAVLADSSIDRATFAADTGLQTVRSNTAQGGGGTSITLDASASSSNNFYNGRYVYITGGTGVGQARVISAYNGSTKIATVSRNWVTNPDNTSTFAILPVDAPRLNASLNVTAAVAQTIIRSGTAQSGSTSNTIVLDSGASTTNNIYNGSLVTTTGGTGLGQARTIIAYNGTTKVATVDRAWVTTPTNTTTFDIYASTSPTTFSDQGVAQAGGATSLTLQSTASATDSIYVGSLLTILSGTGSGGTREITAYNGTTKVATVDSAWSVTPDSTSAYAVIPSSAASGGVGGGSAPTAAENALAVWQSTVPGIFTSGMAGYAVGTYLTTTVLDAAGVRTAVGLASANLDTQLAAIVADSNELQTDWTNGGRLDVLIDAIKAKTDNLPSDPADASDIASSFSTVNTTLATIAGYIDTEVATIVTATGASAIRAAIGLASANLDTQLSAIAADLPGRITKNTALSAFEFFMVDASDHVSGKTGLTVTATRSIDGGAFASCANSASEVGSGVYKIDLAAADLNGNVVTLKFTATGADPTVITIVTQVT